MPFYPASLRYMTICCITLPTLLLSLILISACIVFNLSLELYISQYYNGPLKTLASFIPPLLYTISVPTLSGSVCKIMEWLNDKENRRTEIEHSNNLSQKTFAIMSLIVYLNLYAIAFVFIPLNDFLGGSGEEIGPEMFTSRLFYYVVTGQVWISILTVDHQYFPGSYNPLLSPQGY
jgi:anoctamin-10